MTSTTVVPRPAAETHLTRAPLPEVSTTSPPGPAASTAVLSNDERYRYTLTRAWGSGPRMLWVGLNPSTADARREDASTRRMINFTKAAGFGSLELVNLWGFRSTDPAGLRGAADPIGPDNDTWIRAAVQSADLVVAAWGMHTDPARSAAVLELLSCVTVWCLGHTKGGHPRHPLYVPAHTPFTIHRRPCHDWTDWEPVPTSGLPESLRQRICPTCGHDEIDVADQHRGAWS